MLAGRAGRAAASASLALGGGRVAASCPWRTGPEGLFEKGGPKDHKLGTEWGNNGIVVMGQMGINLQLADVIYPCSEGWESPELASGLHYVC